MTSRLAERIRIEREARGWSLSDLAERSGVSRAMISKIERGEASPTASLLGRLSGAYGLTLSSLLARAETEGAERLRRHEQQPVWRDSATGFSRRAVSPGGLAGIELVEAELPPGVRIAYPASAYAFIRQQIWVLAGTLDFTEAGTTSRLQPGDCLELGSPSDCEFANAGAEPVRYLVVVVRR